MLVLKVFLQYMILEYLVNVALYPKCAGLWSQPTLAVHQANLAMFLFFDVCHTSLFVISYTALSKALKFLCVTIYVDVRCRNSIFILLPIYHSAESKKIFLEFVNLVNSLYTSAVFVKVYW